jgi:hypothetical protein
MAYTKNSTITKDSMSPERPGKSHQRHPIIQCEVSDADIQDQALPRDQARLEIIAITKNRVARSLELWALEPRNRTMWTVSTLAPHSKMRSTAESDRMMNILIESQLTVQSSGVSQVGRISRDTLSEVVYILAKAVSDEEFDNISVREILIKVDVKKLLGIMFEDERSG